MVTDLRIARAILRKICVENNVPQGDVYVHPKFKYVENVLHGGDVSFKKTTYNGNTYQVRYASGAFYPFIFETK